ncbi:MAG: response regulator, partial [Nitrospirales bacterium]
TGKEALEHLRLYAKTAEESGQPLSDYVEGLLTDIEMPEMDGFSLTKHIRQDPRFLEVPILMHSSLSGSCNVEKGKSVGVTDFVTKFDPKILRQKLVQHIGMSKA